VESAQFLGFQKGGDPARKLYATVQAITSDARVLLTTLDAAVRGEAEHPRGELHDYEALELSMSSWSVCEFERFRGNTMIKLKNKVPLSQYEVDCSAVWTQLAQWVSHRAEVADDVYFLGTKRLTKQCPGNFEDDVSEYGKALQLYRWSNKQKQIVTMSLQEWLEGEEHERSSLLLMGDAEVGKSKLSMLLAQELTIGKGADRFTFTKSVDGLGILSYAGDLRQSGAIVMQDIAFSAARGKRLGHEDMKALLDCMEGGCVKDCRYKPGNLPPSVPRIIGLQGAEEQAGLCFRENEQENLARFVEAVVPRTNEAGRAETVSAFRARMAELVRGFDAHERAILRRVSIAVPRAPLVTAAFVRRLEGGNRNSAAAQAERRRAYWAAQRARE
jgi:hypothetical protein